MRVFAVIFILSSFSFQVDIPGLLIGQREYYPYVYFNIKLNIFER